MLFHFACLFKEKEEHEEVDGGGDGCKDKGGRAKEPVGIAEFAPNPGADDKRKASNAIYDTESFCAVIGVGEIGCCRHHKA